MGEMNWPIIIMLCHINIGTNDGLRPHRAIKKKTFLHCFLFITFSPHYNSQKSPNVTWLSNSLACFLSKGGWNVVPGTLITCTRGSGAVHGSVQKASDWKNKRLQDAVSTEGGCAAQVLSNGALPKILPQSTPNHDPGGTNSEGKVPQETNTSLGTVCRKWAWESVKDRSASSPTHSLFHFILCSLRLGFVSTDKGRAKLPISKII